MRSQFLPEVYFFAHAEEILTWKYYLVVEINKPLSCLYQHGRQPGQLTKYVPEIILFMEKNLVEPPYSSGVYLSLIPNNVQARYKAH
jgi:hypothetical protein